MTMQQIAGDAIGWFSRHSVLASDVDGELRGFGYRRHRRGASDEAGPLERDEPPRRLGHDFVGQCADLVRGVHGGYCDRWVLGQAQGLVAAELVVRAKAGDTA